MMSKDDLVLSRPANQETSQPSTAVFVLGMHRSGTSALTRSLNLLGVALGENLMEAVADNNEAGFWEHQGVVDIHERLLADLGFGWDDTRAMPSAWETGTAAAVARGHLVDLLKADFGSAPLWGVKDPRQCRLVPLWTAVASELGVRPTFVIMLRNPLEIARSLSRRDGIPAGRALLLWMRYTLEAERFTRGEHRCFVDYDGLMGNWRRTTKIIEDGLGLGLAMDDPGAANDIDAFITPRLRHHAITADQLFDEPALAEWAGEIQKILSASGPDGPSVADQARLDGLRQDLDRAAYYFDDMVRDASDRERRLTDEMRGLHERLHEKEIAVAERDNTIQERERLAASRASLLNDTIRLKEDQISIQEKLLQEREAQIEVEKHYIEDLKAHIRRQADDYDARAAAMTADLGAAREAHSRAERMLSYVQSSWSWRIGMPFRLIGRGWQSLLGTLRLRRHRLIVDGLVNIERGEGNKFVATDPTCHMLLSSDKGRLPVGWVELTYQIDSPHFLAPSIFADDGHGITEGNRIHLPPMRGGEITTQVRLPNRTLALRFDPVSQLGPFSVPRLEARELNSFGLAIALLMRRAKREESAGGGLIGVAKLLYQEWQKRGLFGVKTIIRKEALERSLDYPQWYEAFGGLGAIDRAAIERHLADMQSIPAALTTVSVGSQDPARVAETVSSLRDQMLDGTRIALLETRSTSAENRTANAKLADADSRIDVFGGADTSSFAEALRQALTATTPDFLVSLDAGDRLAPQALYAFASALEAASGVSVVYADEDMTDPATRICEASFKPDWSPDLLLARDYMGHGVALRVRDLEAAGGFRDGIEGAEIYDAVLRIAGSGDGRNVAHVPMVLCHRPAVPKTDTVLNAAKKAVEDHLANINVAATVETGMTPDSRHVVYALPSAPPKVSLIVPTRDRLELLRVCVDGVIETNDYPNWEMIIVDNGSEEPETLTYMAEKAKDPRIRIHRDEGPFNFSRLNNDAAAIASGEIIGLLNNDIEPIHADWLTEMVRQVSRPGVGAVGAKLYYPNNTVQHGGVIIGVGGLAGHFHKHLKRTDRGFDDRLQLVQNLSAVTAACMLVPKKVFDEVEGLDTTHLAVAFNDVDLCLKIVEAGYRIIWTPFAELYHHESVSRGDDMAPDKIDRFRYEVQTMQARWAKRLKRDPYYSPNLGITREVIEPAFPPRFDRPWEPYFET